jgi:hypothetical protein
MRRVQGDGVSLAVDDRRPTIEQRERSWYPLLFQFEGTAEQLLMHDEWRYERIEGASHWMQLDAPDRVTSCCSSGSTLIQGQAGGPGSW